MATYTAITDAEIDQDSPITQTLMTKYRDNLIAVFEGDASAPRVVAEAFSGSVAGSTVLFGLSGITYPNTSSNEIFIPEATFKATTSCEIRVSAQYRRTGSNGQTVTMRIYKNGSAVLTQSKSSTSYSTHTVDISLVAGDCIRISGQGQSGDGVDITDIKYLTGSQRSVGGI